MRIVYYTLIPGQKPIGAINTEESVEELRHKGVIEKGTKALVVEFDVDNPTPADEEQAALFYHVQYCQFDNYRQPTRVVADLELMQFKLLDDLRTQRAKLLDMLDRVQLRAIAEQRQDVVDEVNADKQALRDVTETLRVENPTSISQFYNRDYGPLRIDYDAKYRARFQ